MQAASILCTQSFSIKINVCNFSKQKGTNDCGLFAIAAAVFICLGFDSGSILFQQAKMRSHLLKCFENGLFTQFPFISRNMDKLLVFKKLFVYQYIAIVDCQIMVKKKRQNVINVNVGITKRENIPSTEFSFNSNRGRVA